MLKNPIVVLIAILVALALSVLFFVQTNKIKNNINDLYVKFELVSDELSSTKALADSNAAEIKAMKKRIDEIEDD
jgi:hypothetical protein